MKTRIDYKGDDAELNRLLSYFKTIFTEDISQFIRIRKSVYLLSTQKRRYLVKGYKMYNKLRLQEAFTETLRKEGFLKTTQFLAPPAKEPLFFEGLHFGCMDYIEPHPVPFSFSTQRERKDGIDLLGEFHQVTSSIEARYRTLIPKDQLIEKWNERLSLFSGNLPFFKSFINDQQLQEIISWANWSLEGMDSKPAFFTEAPWVILHGDVAHHNFLRDKRGRLHLIDFDLISIGPALLDYLQYANRILPALNWSLPGLFRLKQYWPYMNENAFLYALAFPTDIFREWNRAIREGSTADYFKMKQLLDLTAGQFFARKKFVEQLKDRIARQSL